MNPMKMKQYLLLLMLAMPAFCLSQGKFGGGNGQGWAMQTLLNQSLAVGIAAPRPEGSWEIYPNPVRSQVFLKNLSEEAEYRICDALGREIIRGMAMVGHPIDLNGLPAGFYTMVVRGEGRKFLKE
jgi:hypothetical protein